ncbi:MAG: hypothetical protein NHG36_05435, partial [Chromatiaceae bacterium]|nr:hypothetical protein [Candidatus Thioaporhodococcus sediminis]
QLLHRCQAGGGDGGEEHNQQYGDQSHPGLGAGTVSPSQNSPTPGPTDLAWGDKERIMPFPHEFGISRAGAAAE